MNQTQPSSASKGQHKKSTHNKQQSGKSPPRKFAEWVSLSISVLLILGLTGYLINEALQSNDNLVLVTVRVLTAQSGRAGEQYVLPVEVTNRGSHTLRDLQVEVTAHAKDSSASEEPQKREITIDYLG